MHNVQPQQDDGCHLHANATHQLTPSCALHLPERRLLVQVQVKPDGHRVEHARCVEAQVQRHLGGRHVRHGVCEVEEEGLNGLGQGHPGIPGRGPAAWEAA